MTLQKTRAVTIVQRRRGRQPATPGTIRIGPSGFVRLSQDLCTASDYQVALDKEAQVLVIRPDGPYKMWYPNKPAYSGWLYLRVVLQQLGGNLKKLAGEYAVESLGVKEGFKVRLKK